MERKEIAVLIDCDNCRVRDLECGDCVVTVLLGSRDHHEQEHDPVELDGQDRAAIAVLASSGLVPPLRLVTDRATPEERPGVPVREGDHDVKSRATG